SINRWGDEIYFEIPVESEIENGVEILDIGSLAYWPPGNAFCIFFGLTPASTDEKPRAAGPVNLIGNIKDKNDLIILKSLSNSQSINISKK
ncbi:MAG: cyclophilin-like family protein, partial [Candidatus Humimicrobiaceae bacterium]